MFEQHLYNLETIANNADETTANALRHTISAIREDEARQRARDYDYSQNEYWGCVQSIAREALDEHGADDEAHDYIYESVDGSQWIIYNRRVLLVLQYTRNDEAWQDVGLNCKSNHWDIITTMAFWAMRQDVIDAWQELVDNMPEDIDTDTDTDSDSDK